MKKFLTVLLVCILFGCASSDSGNSEILNTAYMILDVLEDGSEHNVVVNYFLEDGEVTEESEYIQEEMTIALSNAAMWDKVPVNVVSRQFLDDIIEEQKFQLTGLADPDTQAEIGKLLGADIIVVGNLYYYEEDDYLNAKTQVININTGAVLGGFTFDFWWDE